MREKPIAVTTGEPAGIGPEVALKAAVAADYPIVLLGDRALLDATRKKLGLPTLPANVAVEDVPLSVPAVPGQLDVRNSAYVVKLLERGCDGALAGDFAAVATAPVQKSILCDAGLHFTGHTEFFADRSRVKRVVMMLVSSEADDALKVPLVTTHLPIKELSAAITGERLDETLSILHRALKTYYGLSDPKIAVTGLNPHALKRARAKGMSVTGPWPADTIFVREHERQYDAVLCMYHDQGLPVLKREGFGHGVNVTLGLPWIRTSVDHGTALDIAGKGIADAGSMTAALHLARRMAHRAQRL